MKWLAELEQRRRTWHEATTLNNFQDGVQRNMVEKYADPSHFVFELLQNAEDQGATEAIFELLDDRMVFQHNGSGFTNQDVENITGIGNSDKPDQPNKIGRFGIGFKSVFAITARPEVFTFLEGQPFAFAIEHLVVPTPIDLQGRATRSGWTRFVLPFLPQDRDVLLRVVGERLETLGADTMLFLRGLAWIEWTTMTKQGSYLCSRLADGRVDLEEQVGSKGAQLRSAKSQYLLFSKEVHVEGADRDLQISIGFPLRNGAIVPEHGQSTLNVFFPTREPTRLRFRMHGPFLLNDGRANLRDDCPVNEVLIGACAELLADTLPKLRDAGYLKPSCLEVLPIRPSDFEGSVFKPMYDATLRAFAQQPLLPTDEGTHVRSSKAKITDSQPLRNLLNAAQLSALFDADGSKEDGVAWLASEIQKNAAATKEIYDYLLRQLRVDEVDSEKLAARITGSFLVEQTDGWICSLYELLDNQQALWRPKTGYQSQGALRAKPIIRTESGTQVVPFRDDGTPRVYMPSGIGSPEKTVKRSIESNAVAKSFLVKLGLEPRSSTDEVLEVILPRIQRYDVEECLARYTSFLPGYLADLAVIRSAIDKCSIARAGQLKSALLSAPFVLSFNAEDDLRLSLKRPSDVKIPSEEFAFWYAGDPNIWFVSGDLQEEKDWRHVVNFLNAGRVVVLDELEPTFRTPNSEGYVALTSFHGDHSRGLHRFDPHAEIPGMAYALQNINEHRSRMLWNLLLSHSHLVRGLVESSSRQSFENSETAERRSIIGNLCLTSAWLPDRCNNWLKPEDISLEELSSGFESDSPQAEALAGALGFKNAGEREALRSLGIPAEDVWVIRSLAQNPWLLSRLKNELSLEASRAPFPSSAMPNIERLTERVSSEAKGSESITHEVRPRSVRTSLPGGQDARSYLESRYTDEDQELRCQCCEQPMPFRLDDGTPYFEAIQLLKIIRQELYQNRIALCPTCAAKFRFALGTTDEEIYELVLTAPSDQPTISVHLARECRTIRFNPRHLKELQVAVRSILAGVTGA